jgi:predicted outer membrane repeat protein
MKMNPHQRLCLGILVIITCLFAFNTSKAEIIYVDADIDASHDGQSWQTAYHKLQDALAIAVSGDEIRVAQGFYRPDATLTDPTGTGDRYAVFDLADGIMLQGGYAGFGAEDPDTRDIAVYETILSGDLDGNDTELTNPSQLLSDPNRSENSYHVISMTGSTANLILDGFTITGGMAVGADPHNTGGGIRMVSSNPTISNCRFEYNAAANGGAVYNLTSSPILTNCIFFKNYAQNAGGSLRNIASSSPALSGCRFIENKAAGFGGAMANSNNSSPTVMQCTFSYNWANQGGAINNYDFCNSQIIRSIFLYNASDTNGGAFSNQNHSDTELINCGLFSNASPYGACLYNDQSNSRMVNCVASGNAAVEYGGVLYNRDAVDISMTNCTFVGNTAAIQGASLYNVFSNPTIQNCILWDGVDANNAPIYTESGSLTVNYSCIQGGWIGGAGNIDTDPLFIDPNGADGVIGTSDDNFKLLAESLCIDAGDNMAVPADISDLDNDSDLLERIPLDFNDKARFVNVPDVIDTGLADLPMYPDVIDMGALERNKPILVDILSPGPEHDGTVWDKAFNHLQDALAIAEKGDVIWVAQGVYCPDRSQAVPTDSGDHTAAFELIDGVVLKGGYAGWSQADPNIRDIQTYPTILSGDLLGNDTPVTDPAQMINDPTRFDNSYHILMSDNTGEYTELDGFTITGGMAVGTDPHNTGGGIRMISSNPTISNCSFEYNVAVYGGAVYNTASTPIFTECNIFRNYADNHGGGFRNYNFSSPELSNCIFIENKAAGFGGAMANTNNSSPTIMQCTFSYNWGNQGGGAVNNYDYCSPQITQSIFEYNATDNDGGALRNENYSDAESINCDFTANTALSGGAIYNNSSAPTVTGCNFIDNTTTGSGGAIFSTNSTLIVQKSAFTTNQSGNYGGALYNVSSSSLNVADCIFTSNTAIRGGAVFCDNSTSTVAGSTFLDNTTTNSDSDSDESGGAIFNRFAGLSISQSIFRENESYVNGGAVYNTNGNLSIEKRCRLWRRNCQYQYRFKRNRPYPLHPQ